MVNWGICIIREEEGLVSTKILFDGFGDESNVEDDHANCDVCHKWRFVSPEVFKKIQNTDQFCCSDVKGLTCEKFEDPRVWFVHEGTKVVSDGALKLAEDDENDEFGLFAGLPRCNDGYSSSEETEPDEILTAKRCQEATNSLASCSVLSEANSGLTPDVSGEMRSSLLRLGADEVTQADIDRLRKIAENIVHAAKNGKLVVRQLIVKNESALDAGNPQRPKLIEGIQLEISLLFTGNNVRVTYPRQRVSTNFVRATKFCPHYLYQRKRIADATRRALQRQVTSNEKNRPALLRRSWGTTRGYSTYGARYLGDGGGFK